MEPKEVEEKKFLENMFDATDQITSLLVAYRSALILKGIDIKTAENMMRDYSVVFWNNCFKTAFAQNGE